MVVLHGLSSSEGTWDLPGPGIELMSPALAGFFTMSHYGNPQTLKMEIGSQKISSF